jgi:hypothetical protein
MTDHDGERRLAALESRLERLEQLLVGIDARLERSVGNLADAKAGLQAWVTDYVSLRLQQLVPETCEHPADGHVGIAAGPVLPGTRVR